MGERLDIIIFGATGFTGKNTIPQVFKLTKEEGRSLTWGISGRSEKKCKDILAEMSKKIDKDLSDVPIIVADVSDEESLKKMTARARIIINTCGPYRFYGEPVIKACLETGTHHVDVSGEPQFIENMELKYHELAKEKGIYIVSACGLDSIPCDLGVYFLQSKFKGTINTIETYLTLKEVNGRKPGPGINYGTWESAVHGISHWSELKDIRKQLNAKKLPQFKPRLEKRSKVHTCEINNAYALPFMGSDRSVALRSQRYFYEEENKRPAQIGTYFCVNSIFEIAALAVFGLIFLILSRFSFGRKLLLDHPSFFSGGFFSREGPSDEKMENTEFAILLYGKGWPENLETKDDQYVELPTKTIVGKVSGMNPGYGATTIMLTLSALMILCEPNKLPKKGGVYPPSAAFAHTSLIQQLNKNNVKFEILSDSDIKNKL